MSPFLQPQRDQQSRINRKSHREMERKGEEGGAGGTRGGARAAVSTASWGGRGLGYWSPPGPGGSPPLQGCGLAGCLSHPPKGQPSTHALLHPGQPRAPQPVL